MAGSSAPRRSLHLPRRLSPLLLLLAVAPTRAWRAAPLRLASRAAAAAPSARTAAAPPRSAVRADALFALSNADVTAAFNWATFGPQPLWLLMICLPRWSVTRALVRPIAPIVLFSLVHLLIVVASAGQEGGTAPLMEFAGVFDSSPGADPQGAMVGMMKYPNFVSEEWSHVLTWDLFVGRFIWADGLARGVPIRASVLLTNLIGPPGLLLHLATCLVSGKGLPPPPQIVAIPEAELLNSPEAADTAPASPQPASLSGLLATLNFGANSQAILPSFGSRPARPLPERADSLVLRLFDEQRFDETGLRALGASLADGIVWDDLSGGAGPISGREAVLRFLAQREGATPADFQLSVERVADGVRSSGFTWTRTAGKSEGLRGSAYIELDPLSGKLLYVQEVAEPLLKPGGATAALLKAVVKPPSPTNAPAYTRRTPRRADDLVRYLWEEVQGSDMSESLRLFSEDILYEDFNFQKPFEGKAAVQAFLKEFDIPGVSFVPQRISEGDRAVAFTWQVVLNGVEGRQIQGISFYELEPASKQVSFVRDIPEPAVRPAPLGALAAVLRPGLRKL